VRLDGRSDVLRPRLVDVARLAGVTKGTASRILRNDSTLVTRQETRERVLTASVELGYRPHPVARALATSSAQVVALLAPSLGNPAFAPLVRAAQRRAQQLGYVLVTSEDPDDQLADMAFARLVEQGRIDGLIIASARPDHEVVELLEKSRLGLPHVFVYREVARSHNNVHLDIRQSAVIAARHLLSFGHQRVGHIGGPPGNRLWTNHANAFERALERAGGVAVIERAGFSEAGGYEAVSRIFDANPRVTAVYASSLLQAVGVLSALRGLKKAVPDDISVLAYDELPMAEYLSPPLSTVAVPIERLGTAAVDAIIERLHGAAPRNIKVACRPHIVARSSTGPAPEANSPSG
jgi:DNA-binding LacI/PurR family transcriptional regulator